MTLPLPHSKVTSVVLGIVTTSHFLVLKSILVPGGCHKLPHTVWFKTTDICYLKVLVANGKNNNKV